MSNPLTILRSYARKADPSVLPPTILFEHTPKTLTVFDAYPKSIFHFLILPRPSAYPSLTETNLTNLRELLKCDREKAKEVIMDLYEESQKLRKVVEEEMVQMHGFKWDIWVGFHPIPSRIIGRLMFAKHEEEETLQFLPTQEWVLPKTERGYRVV